MLCQTCFYIVSISYIKNEFLCCSTSSGIVEDAV